MSRPPRPADESVLGAGFNRAVLGTGFLIGACTLTVGVVAASLSMLWQSLAFPVLGFGRHSGSSDRDGDAPPQVGVGMIRTCGGRLAGV